MNKTCIRIDFGSIYKVRYSPKMYNNITLNLMFKMYFFFKFLCEHVHLHYDQIVKYSPLW